MIRKVIRIGNSYGVTLDPRLMKKVGIDGAEWVWVELSIDKKSIVIRKRTPSDW